MQLRPNIAAAGLLLALAGAVMAGGADRSGADGEAHWAFAPPRKPAVPAAGPDGWSRTTIDRFLAARWRGRGIEPVADADRYTLIRRLAFDLTGLPPSPQMVQAFVTDRSPRALERIVDRLLASPQFGERWGRHWLDVARYAESSGKTYNVAYPYAWRYRDYVIDAFNADKPYDRFIREQIAGDLMPVDSEAQRIERLVATGFLALGVKDHNARNDKQFAMDVVDEQLSVATRAVLALNAGCARCHDHKFDPITIEDYYGLAGILRSTEPLYGTSDVKGKGGTPNKYPAELQPIGPGARKLHEAVLAYEQKAGELSRKERRARRDVQNLTDKIEAAEDAKKKKKLRQDLEKAKKRRSKVSRSRCDTGTVSCTVLRATVRSRVGSKPS